MSGGWTRRDCLRAGLAGGALCVGWQATAAPDVATDAQPSRPADAPLGLWLLIGTDCAITLRTNASEMGQGSSSALAQIVAEELEQPWGEIRLVMAPIEPAYFGVWNDYVTGGSGSVRGMFEKLRLASATARELLLTAAARRWRVPVTECTLSTGAVMHAATARRLPFGELVHDAASIELAAPATPRPRATWRVIGLPLPRLDLRDKITGTAIFGIDAGPQDALVATLRHAPRFGGEPRRWPADTPDVTFVRLPGAIAAVAREYWVARRALDRAALEWTDPDHVVDARDLDRRLREALDADGEIRWRKPEQHAALRASNAAAFARAARVVEAQYETPLLAHACMEPMNATAVVSATAATLWAPTQVQASMRRDVARALSLPESAVTLHTTLLGGGFGRRLETDFGVQAALLARAVGRPVKLIWSREEDLRRDFFRQSAMGRFRAAVAEDGTVLALRARLAALKDCSPAGLPSYSLPDFLATVVGVPRACRSGPGVPSNAITTCSSSSRSSTSLHTRRTVRHCRFDARGSRTSRARCASSTPRSPRPAWSARPRRATSASRCA